MFEIKIGTVLMGAHALDPDMLPALEPFGFEGYEVSLDRYCFRTYDIAEYAKRLNDALCGTPLSALGCYANPLASEDDRRDLIHLMDCAHLFGCNTISVFAGALPDHTVAESMPTFKKVFSELCARAEDKGLKIAMENCSGSSWTSRDNYNIAYGPDAWEMMFDAIPSEALGLEWEPAHQLIQLIDPIAELRVWAKKIVHMHGKDTSVDWDAVKRRGIYAMRDFAPERTPGFGDTDWRDIFSILHENGYAGDVCIEGYHDPVYGGEWEMTSQLHAVKYLKFCRGGDFIPNPWDEK